MPNTSAGMVIGKHRTTIKLFPKHFGCQIQVFPKSVEAKAALERVVTVAHEDSAILLGAVRRVLQKVALDPHHCSEIKDEDFKDNKNSQIVRSPVKVEEIEEMKPFLCTKSEKMCFNRLKEEYMLTGEIGGCPTPVSDHPTADDIRQWAIGYEAIRKY
ncbi:hypothetical protein CRE_28808 [Caenorhabditis remanei]|uniref:K Homology domain-containing protein n=1 Tax=Caenorhabditis remanei TaxID=31234 RepID=E3MK73_CAERE|nr:hypothetical protein CRE_28808 [Caenorhabditis remanei]